MRFNYRFKKEDRVMNKSERNKLSDIIASMIYSDSTTPEVADYGHQLLKAFPCIEELMCNSQEEVLEDKKKALL